MERQYCMRALLAVGLVAAVLSAGCGRRIIAPNVVDKNVSVGLQMAIPGLPDGTPVYLTGNLAPGYAVNSDTLLFIGTSSGDTVQSNVTLTVKYDAPYWFNAKGLTAKGHETIDGTLRMHGTNVPFSTGDKFGPLRLFKVVPGTSGPKIVPLQAPLNFTLVNFEYTGVNSNPGLAEFNEPADQNKPLRLVCTWHGEHWPVLGDWTGHSWTWAVPCVIGDTTLVAPIDATGRVLYAGFFAQVGSSRTELMNLEDGDPGPGTYALFGGKASADNFANLRAGDERWATIRPGRAPNRLHDNHTGRGARVLTF